MSSTSTNKQPLLVDRPLHNFAILGGTPCLVDPANYASVVGGGCQTLVDCFDNDGALIDSISIVANQANTTQSDVLIFISFSPTIFGVTAENTVLVAAETIQSGAPGDRTNVSLPPLTVPVPHLGAQGAPTEFSKKNTGLYVPSGALLYTGINQALSAPAPITRVTVFAQGGYF